MSLTFYKYQGTGNDFIIIDNRELLWELDTEEISALCNRRMGIGADGLMLLNTSQEYAFEMKYFNADGKPGSMCGNGARCIVAFAKFLNIIDKEVRFWAPDGEHFAEVLQHLGNESLIRLQMKNVGHIERKTENVFFLNTGSPHHVEFVTHLQAVDVFSLGKEIRYSGAYIKQHGTNVNFVEQSPEGLFVRTYERGVEDETYSCGTGVTASALAFAHKTGNSGPIKIKTRGGDLQVDFKQIDTQHFQDIFLQGIVKQVFKGIIELKVEKQ